MYGTMRHITSSDSDHTPIPRKRTHPIGTMSLTSPVKDIIDNQSSSRSISSSNKTPRSINSPKPKPRKLSSTSRAPPLEQQPSPAVPSHYHLSPSTLDVEKKGHSRSNRLDRLGHRADGLENLSPQRCTTPAFRVREILHTFHDDVVPLSQNRWHETVEHIQAQLHFPDVGWESHSNPSFVSRESLGIDSNSVPSKWKSAALLVPHDESMARHPQCKEEVLATYKYCGDGILTLIKNLGSCASGILGGLLLWHSIFTISQMIAGDPISSISTLDEKSRHFWVIYWTATSVLLLSMILGFLQRIEDSSLFKCTLHLLPCLLIGSSYYLSKTFHLQRLECSQYFAVLNETDLKRIHLTYTCDFMKSNGVNYWKSSLIFLPTIGSILIHILIIFSPFSSQQYGNHTL